MEGIEDLKLKDYPKKDLKDMLGFRLLKLVGSKLVDKSTIEPLVADILKDIAPLLKG